MPFSGWYGRAFEFDPDAGTTAGLSEKDLALLIMAVLEDGPAPGYQVALELEERSKGKIHADPEPVYPLLQLLVDRELVSVADPEAEKRVYELTDRGREVVETRRRRIEWLWRQVRAGGAGFDQAAFDHAMDDACHSVRSAVREVRQAMDEILDGVFRTCCGGRTHGRRHRGSDSGCC